MAEDWKAAAYRADATPEEIASVVVAEAVRRMPPLVSDSNGEESQARFRADMAQARAAGIVRPMGEDDVVTLTVIATCDEGSEA